MQALPPINLLTSVALKPLKTETSQKFIEILAYGAIRYCIKNDVDIPRTYKDFLHDIVDPAKRKGKNGTFLINDEREKMAIRKLFGINLASDDLLEQLMTLDILSKLTTSPDEKRNALQSFGPKFNELSEAFGSGICHNKLVFEKMQELGMSAILEVARQEV